MNSINYIKQLLGKFVCQCMFDWFFGLRRKQNESNIHIHTKNNIYNNIPITSAISCGKYFQSIQDFCYFICVYIDPLCTNCHRQHQNHTIQFINSFQIFKMASLSTMHLINHSPASRRRIMSSAAAKLHLPECFTITKSTISSLFECSNVSIVYFAYAIIYIYIYPRKN